MIDQATTEATTEGSKKNRVKRLKKDTSKKSQDYVQLLFRCDPELHIRIIKALGVTMSRSGNKVSKNTFVLHLLEMGLKSFERGH